MGKNPDLGSRMNIPKHFSEGFETVFGVKILQFFDADPDPGSGMRDLFDPGLDPGSRMEKFGSGIRNKHPGSVFSFEYNLFLIHCEVIPEIVFFCC
jgi:hypothetical protein